MKKPISHIFSVDEIKTIVVPIANEYGVDRMVLFGSYARGEATGNSDIDIYIDVEQGWGGYFKLASLQNKLENALGSRVDLLTTGAFDSEIFENVKGDEIVLYKQRTT